MKKALVKWVSILSGVGIVATTVPTVMMNGPQLVDSNPQTETTVVEEETVSEETQDSSSLVIEEPTTTEEVGLNTVEQDSDRQSNPLVLPQEPQDEPTVVVEEKVEEPTKPVELPEFNLDELPESGFGTSMLLVSGLSLGVLGVTKLKDKE